MKKGTYFIASLGCAKNTVDSESMALLLAKEGLHMASKPEDAQFLIVNTCGFIDAARQESLQALEEFSAIKQPGQILIAAGCLTQRFPQLVSERIKAIDAIMGTRRWMDIVTVAQKAQGRHLKTHFHLPDVSTVGSEDINILRAARQGGSAYLKIADGCRRTCAYCSIPAIKGTQVSRPLSRILNDARDLQKSHVKEIILISQDTSDYGSDLGIKDGLPYLLENLVNAVPEIPWIRILYTFPGFVSDQLIRLMADTPQILPYLDLPLQHAHPDVLRRMNRPANIQWVYETIAKMRNAMPELAMRTTFIVGHPGETEKEFDFLLNFVREIQFDHVGAFTFSFEEGTPGASMGDPVPSEIKEQRWQQLMLVQEEIALEKNRQWIGKTLPILIEGCGDGISVGRSYRDAPEIDGLVILSDQELPEGSLVNVRITDALTHDMFGILA
jgi:ribosomal protein S12 methylthiotransferase